MSNVSLKIYFPEKKLYKLLQFSGEQKVQDAIQFIHQKYECDSTDHGLVYNKAWLDPKKTMGEYGLKFGDILEIRKKHRVLKVWLMDKTVKSVLIDESLPVYKIVSAICQKIGLSNGMEYSLLPMPDKKRFNDDFKWLHSDKTLREQSIGESDMVLLKKKFYFSDQQVDKNDPVQLGLLYSQAHEMILEGKHPITLEEAVVFAALQMQITYGNHEPDRFKKGFLILKDFIPSEYVKQRDIEKNIYTEHAKLYSLSGISAKFKYVQLSRSLKTYGLTFFVVNERAANKRLMVQYLLGVSRNGIVKMDMKTKATLKEWKLTQIRRWASTDNSLTLDFGEFADSYYAVETHQGNEIAQQISGYITIILKSRNDQQNLEQDSLIFDSKRQLSISPTIKKQLGHDLLEGDLNDRPTDARNQSFSVKGLCDDTIIAEEQKKTLETIQNGFLIAKTAKSDMFVVMNSSKINEDPNLETWKNDIININIETMASLSASKLSALSLLIMHSTGNIFGMEYPTIISNLNTMIENLRQISQNVKVLATLFNPEESDMMIQLGKLAVDSFISVLSALKNIILGETFMEKLYISTSQLADNISALLFFINKLGIDEIEQKEIIVCAGDVAQSSNLIQEKTLWLPSSILDDDLLQNIQQYTHNVIETSNMLVAVTEVLSPVLDLPRCRETFFLAMILMEDSLKPPKIGKEFVSDSEIISDFMKSIEGTEVRLAALIDKIKKEEAEYLDEIEVLFEYAHVSMVELLENHSVNSILQRSKDLINQLESLAEILDGKSQQFKTESERLLALHDSKNMYKLCEDVTEFTKSLVKKWDDLDTKNSFSSFMKDSQSKLEILAAPYIIASSTKKITLAFKNTLSSAHQLISAEKSAGASNRDQTSQINAAKVIKDIYNLIPGCVQALKFIKENPNDHVNRSVLIMEGNKFIEECEKLTVACKKTIPTISDQSAKENLSSSVKQMSSDIADLKKGCSLAMHLKGKDEINHALASLRNTQSELEHAITNSPQAIVGEPTDLRSKEEWHMSINSKIKSINAQLNLFRDKDNTKDVAGEIAIGTVSDYQNLTYLSIQLAKSNCYNDDSNNFLRILVSVGSSLDFMLQKIQKNIKADQAISTDLENLVIESIITMEGLNDFLPGVQAMLELEQNLLESLEESSVSWAVEIQESESATNDDAIYGLENNLRQAALAVAVASSTLSKSNVSDSMQLKLDIAKLKESYEKFANDSIYLSTASYNPEIRVELGGKIHETGKLVLEFIGTIRFSMVSSSPDAAESVSRKLRETVEAIHLLMDSLTSASNSKNPFVGALKQLDEAFFLLEKAHANPINEVTFEDLIENANLEGIIISKKLSSIDELSTPKEKAECISSSVKRITLANSDIISFIASSDPSTQLASPSVIDQQYFTRKNLDLRDSIERLYCENVSRPLVLSAAQEIARVSGKIIVQLKVNSKNEKLKAKEQAYFGSQAQEIGMNITLLVESMKALARNQTIETRENYKIAAEYLLKSIDNLVSTCESPKFSNRECVVNSQVALKQRRLFDQNIAAINVARVVIEDLKNNTDEETKSVDALQDSVKELLLAISRGRPLFSECEAGKISLEKSITILEKARSDPSDFASGSKNHHNRKTLVDALACISSLVDATLTTEDQITDIDKIADVLQTMVKHFTNNVIIAIDISLALHASYRDSLFEMFTSVGKNMISFLEKVEKAVLKNYEEMKPYMIPSKLELKGHLSGLTAFLIGISDDTLNEFSKVIQQIEKTMVYLEDMHKNFVLAGKKLPDFIFEISESEIILLEFIEEIANSLTREKISDMLQLAQQLPSFYMNLAHQITGASFLIGDPSVQLYLKESQTEFGGLFIRLIESMRNEDIININQISLLLKNKMSEMEDNIGEASQGFFQYEQAIVSVNHILKDYDSSILLAASGNLNSVSMDTSFMDQKQTILLEFRYLFNSLDKLLSADKMTTLEVEAAVTLSLKQLIKAGKIGLEVAAMISAIEGQEQQESFMNGLRMTITSVMNNMSSLISLKHSTVPMDQGSCQKILQECQYTIKKSMDDINSLLETEEVFVESIDSTQNSLKKILEGFLHDEIACGLENPAEVLIILHAFEDSVNAVLKDDGSDHKVLSRRLNVLKLKSLALLEAIKACVDNAPVSIKQNCSDSTKILFESFLTTLKYFKFDKLYHNDQTQENVISSRDTFEDSLASLRVFITKLEPDGFLDKDDPNFKNARDLATLANSLEQVSWDIKNKGVKCPDPDTSHQDDDSFHGLLIRMVKEITEATTALLKASIVSQKEIVKKGKSLPPAEANGTWSDGIISAAKDVGLSAKELFELAQKEEKDNDHFLSIINTARQINASTVQILTASSVHNSASSKSQLILNSTGKQLMSANEKLVTLCEKQMSQEKVEELSSSTTQTTRTAEEMDAKLNILKLEKQLDRARIKLGSIRKMRYSKSGLPLSVRTSPEKKLTTDYSSRLCNIDAETMESVIKRASILDMVNNVDKDPEFFTPRSSLSIASEKSSFSQRRDFNSNRSHSISSSTNSDHYNPLNISNDKLEEITEET